MSEFKSNRFYSKLHNKSKRFKKSVNVTSITYWNLQTQRYNSITLFTKELDQSAILSQPKELMK